MNILKDILIGVDHGNYSIKTSNFTIPSDIINHGKIDPGLDDLLYFNNHYYSISRIHGTLERNKTNDERYFILTLFSIAKEILKRNASTNSTVVLGIGVPPGHYSSTTEDEYISYFKKGKTISFMYNNIDFLITISNVYVFLQGYGALAYTNCDIVDTTKFKRFILIDIGGGTIELVSVYNMCFDREKRYSLPKGTITINNQIIKKVSSQYALEISEEEINEVLLTNNSLIESAVQELIKNEYKNAALKTIAKARELEQDLMLTRSFFTGGGLKYMKPFFNEKNGVKMPYFEENIRANALGYERLLNDLLLGDS